MNGIGAIWMSYCRESNQLYVWWYFIYSIIICHLLQK